MIHFKIILFILFITLFGYASNTSKEIRFLSGLILLNSTPNLNDSLKSLRYIELQKISGISSKEAIAFIKKYRDDAEGWKKIEDAISKLLNEQENSLKKDESKEATCQKK